MEESSHGQPGSICQASLVAGDSFLLNAPPHSKKEKKKTKETRSCMIQACLREAEAQARTLRCRYSYSFTVFSPVHRNIISLI